MGVCVCVCVCAEVLREAGMDRVQVSGGEGGEESAGVWLCVVKMEEMYCLSVWRKHHVG